jgi:hypothetical protein
LIILDFFSKEVGRNISFENTVFLSPNCNFGNSLAFLNKIIFYSEIIGCKKIILDKNVF